MTGVEAGGAAESVLQAEMGVDQEVAAILLAAVREIGIGGLAKERRFPVDFSANALISVGDIPVAYIAAMMLPMAVPAMRSTGMWFSSIHWITPISESPRAAPPLSARPIRGRLRWGRSRGRRGGELRRYPHIVRQP